MPPVLKRTARGPPITITKSASIASFGGMDRPPTYTRPSYSCESNKKPCALVIIQDVLDHMDVEDVPCADEMVISQTEEFPEEALCF